MTSDLTQLVDVFQKMGQARCKTKTVRVSGTSTDKNKNTTSTFTIEVVEPDQYHFAADTPSGAQAAGRGKFEIIGIGQDVYFRQGDTAWQVPPPQAKSQMSSIYANGLAQAFTFDFSGVQSRADAKATPNPTAVAEMQAMKITKTSATKQGVACDDYQVTIPSSNASPTVFSICVDPGKNLPVEWDITTTTATAQNSVVIAYQWDIPISIAKPIP